MRFFTCWWINGMDEMTLWALIRTICAIICAICGIGTLAGSIIYWKKRLEQDKKRKKRT